MKLPTAEATRKFLFVAAREVAYVFDEGDGYHDRGADDPKDEGAFYEMYE